MFAGRKVKVNPSTARDNEEDETRQENWSFGEDSFKTFASTSPVSKIGITKVSLIIFSHQRLLVGRGRR